MSRTKHRTTRERWQRRARDLLGAAFNAIRPVWFLAIATVGLYFAFDYLSRAPWHHAMIMWVVPAMFAGHALIRLYQSVEAIASFHLWMRQDSAAALASLDDLQRRSHILPPWSRAKYLDRRTRIRAES